MEHRIFDVEFRKTFNKHVLKVYHPSCGHCKNMENDWKNLENTLKSNYTGNVGMSLIFMQMHYQI